MKKSLIALAALAATGAFAQSSVTLSGYIDRGYTMTNNSNDTKDVNTVSSSAGTTSVVISGTEDLGKGLKAGFLVATDWADLAGTNQNSTATTASSIQTGGFANGQSYLELASGFGSLRLGAVNNEILTAATAVAAPAFSTAVGSAYSSAFSTHNGMGTGTTGSGGIVTLVAAGNTGAGARGIRQANTIKYISPSFSGFQVALGYAPKNDVNGTGATVGVTDFSLRYTNAALDVMYAAVKYEVGSALTTAWVNGGLTNGSDSTQQLLAASYAITSALKVHAGLGRSSSSDNLGVDANSRQIGVSYAVTPAIDLMAQIANVDDNSTANADRRMTGLGADYKFSKNTRAYVRYDNIDYNTNLTASGSQQTRTAVGLSVKF